MDTTEYIKTLAREGRLLADAAERAGTEAPVPTCPGWRVADLLRHTGVVHRWAAAFVTEGYASFHPEPDEPAIDGTALLDWYRESHGLLVGALTEAPATLECWTFLPAPSPRAFWARRQAHETAVHRVDAESALPATAGRATPVEARFAADGVDELLCGFHAREKSRVRTAAPATLRVRATDTGDVWTVTLTERPPRTTRTDEGPADCELAGPADKLYLLLWNRLADASPAVTVSGDDRPLRLWRETSAVI
ncbi:maleylpyruvate isomerase family mycothiol-dependent enzyme [Streptomyces sp. NPDC047928]|uniref:maleylpyruvate isomerase family mycothiol-dependent enzyme n=1 Tax=unclassified Streptomyces TaxID=2593676 RepID=UPI0037209B7C